MVRYEHFHGLRTNDMPWSGMLDGVAEKYSGNLKTLLLCLDQSPHRRIPYREPRQLQAWQDKITKTCFPSCFELSLKLHCRVVNSREIWSRHFIDGIGFLMKSLKAFKRRTNSDIHEFLNTQAKQTHQRCSKRYEVASLFGVKCSHNIIPSNQRIQLVIVESQGNPNWDKPQRKLPHQPSEEPEITGRMKWGFPEHASGATLTCNHSSGGQLRCSSCCTWDLSTTLVAYGIWYMYKLSASILLFHGWFGGMPSYGHLWPYSLSKGDKMGQGWAPQAHRQAHRWNGVGLRCTTVPLMRPSESQCET